MNRIEGTLACVALTGAMLYAPAQKAAGSFRQAKNFILAQFERPADPTFEPVNLPVQIFATAEPTAAPAPLPAPNVVVTIPKPPDFATLAGSIAHVRMSPCKEMQRRTESMRRELERSTSEIQRHSTELSVIESASFREQQRRIALEQARIARQILSNLGG